MKVPVLPAQTGPPRWDVVNPAGVIGKKSKEAAVQEVRAALELAGDTHIVDDAERCGSLLLFRCEA